MYSPQVNSFVNRSQMIWLRKASQMKKKIQVFTENLLLENLQYFTQMRCKCILIAGKHTCKWSWMDKWMKYEFILFLFFSFEEVLLMNKYWIFLWFKATLIEMDRFLYPYFLPPSQNKNVMNIKIYESKLCQKYLLKLCKISNRAYWHKRKLPVTNEIKLEILLIMTMALMFNLRKSGSCSQ